MLIPLIFKPISHYLFTHFLTQLTPEQVREVREIIKILKEQGYDTEESNEPINRAQNKEDMKEKFAKMKQTAIDAKRVAAQMMMMANSYDKIVDKLMEQIASL